jgi:SAM-dependent methyltransferase
MPWWDHVLAGPAVGRSSERELLDAEELDPHELRTNLREMAMLNQLPGGVGDSIRAVRWALNGSATPHVLDVGTGSGDFARALRRAMPSVRISAVDLHPDVLAVARRNLARTNDVDVLQADASALPFADSAFSVAHASLLVHHLEPDGVAAALREMRRVAASGVVVNDLRRGRLAVAVSTLTVLALARGSYTRKDGPMSARRAYSLPELDAIAAREGLRVAWRSPAFMPRVTTVYR